MKIFRKLTLLWTGLLIASCWKVLKFMINSPQVSEPILDSNYKHKVNLTDITETADIAHNFQSEEPFLSSQKSHLFNQKLSLSRELMCNTLFSEVPKSCLKTINIYKNLIFNDLDWKFHSSDNQWSDSNRLKVFVVPHSHNDPGWLETFEHYYHHKTNNILKNVINNLSKDSRLKFIWSEISFLSLFWKGIDSTSKIQVKKLLKNGQLEIVTGGWVMNDEANAHYFMILQQMIEGHQWIVNNLEYIPKNSWAIDPFGHSPTMAYFLKEMGLQNLVIQRIHYAVKRHLARTKNLEFYWKQMWDGSKTTDLFTHVMPFTGYGILHTCGPNPKICYQFDFKMLGISSTYYPTPPQVITDRNIEERANLLMEQYRQKARMFRTNVLLVPLGDDFRYKNEHEWDYQFENYQKLFDYINSDEGMHAEVQLATLDDYFKELHSSYSYETFEILSGDFFTYADNKDDYWSGYFTSRPFCKRMDRILMNNLRAAEILYGFAWSSRKNAATGTWLVSSESGLYQILTAARRSISLFQHHDAITGTSKASVMTDYFNKMNDALMGLQHIMQQTVSFLLFNNFRGTFVPNPEIVYFDVHTHSICEKEIVIIEETKPKRVVIFNSLTYKRVEIISICVNTYNILVTTIDGNPIKSQINPVFSHIGGMINSNYYLSFEVEVSPLSLVTYLIHQFPYHEKHTWNTLSKVTLYNCVGQLHTSKGFEQVKIYKELREFSISNYALKADFNKYGFLKAVSLNKNSSSALPVHIGFFLYKANKNSGAYLFHPQGSAEPIFVDPSTVVRVSEGPLYSQIDVGLDIIMHSVKLYHIPNVVSSLGLEIKNIVNIFGLYNAELAMRITSQIKNENIFFTDLNGWQMIRREHLKRLPIQGNFYPMSAAAYIEDDNHRLTLVSGQPGGFGCLNEGQMEIMLDRRLAHEDHRGLGEGVLDNVPNTAVFTLLLEKKEKNCQSAHKNLSFGIMSFYGYLASHSILYPFIKFFPKESNYDNKTEWVFSTGGRALDHDLHLVKLHTILNTTKPTAGIIFHRVPINNCFPVIDGKFVSGNGELNMSSLFPQHFEDTVIPTSLSFLHSQKNISKGYIVKICPMEMKAYLLSQLQKT